MGAIPVLLFLWFDIMHHLHTGHWTGSVRRMIFEMILLFTITLGFFNLPMPLNSHYIFIFTFSFICSFSFTADCLSVQGRPGLRMLPKMLGGCMDVFIFCGHSEWLVFKGMSKKSTLTLAAVVIRKSLGVSLCDSCTSLYSFLCFVHVKGQRIQACLIS